MKWSSLAMALGLGLALAACTDDGMTDGGEPTDRCTEAGSLCVNLHVPDDYTGTPRQIIVGLYESLPPQGPPLVVVSIEEEPEIGVGMPYELTAYDIEDPGDYLLYIVLYNEGGGQFVPEPGIDYTVETNGKNRFGEGAVNMPDMTFQLAE